MDTFRSIERASTGLPGIPGDAGANPTECLDSLHLSAQDRALLTTWARSHTLALRVVLRSRIILLLATSGSVRHVATALGVARGTVRLWRQRVAAHGPEALLRDAPGRGRKPALAPATRQTLRAGYGPDTGVSGRARALELGVSESTISRWRRRS